jgi:threonine dehydrogenase-like Zn-dependent dehydrogenase
MECDCRNWWLVVEIPTQMRAVRLGGQGIDALRIETIPVPEVGPEDVLCRVDATGVCTSNLKLIAQGSEHSLLGGWDLEQFPVILGEEGSLTVVKVGSEVTGIEVGDRYAVQPAVDVAPMTHTERYRDGGVGMKKTVVGYSLDGMLAEYFLVPREVFAGECLVPLPDLNLAHFEVTLAEPISCVHKSQEKHVHLFKDSPMAPRVPRIGILPGGTCVVIGAGTMGRLQAEMAMRFSPKNLIVCAKPGEAADLLKATLAPKAERSGISFFVAAPEEWIETLDRVSPGGADDVIVAIGVKAAQQEAMEHLAFAGVLNLFGGLRRGDHELTLDCLDVHYREVSVVGTSGGDPWDMRATLDILASGELDAENYVVGVGNLEHARDLLVAMSAEKMNGRIILYPHVDIPEFVRTQKWTRGDERRLLAGEPLCDIVG